MTTLPDLDSAAVRAACMANLHPDAEPSATELAKMEKSIRAYLAARSAPEAGKAGGFADDILFELVEKVENRIAYRISLGSTPRAIAEDVLHLALASVPAPSGAEETRVTESCGCVFRDLNVPCRNPECKICHDLPQAVPAEDIGQKPAGTEWKQRWLDAEAEATSLRRKLEERERIGKMMANAAYNIHQRAADIHVGFGLDDAIRSLKSVQEEWDRALSGASE